MAKKLPAMQETWVQSLAQENSLKKEMAIQYSRLENSMDRGTWQATVHGVKKSWTRLSDSHTHTHTHTHNHFTSKVTRLRPGGSDGKASAYNSGDTGSIPESRRSPGEGNGNPLQYSCLENAMDGGTW